MEVSLANMSVLDDDEYLDSPDSGAMTPPVDYFAKARLADRFGVSRAERAWR